MLPRGIGHKRMPGQRKSFAKYATAAKLIAIGEANVYNIIDIFDSIDEQNARTQKL